MKYKNWYKNHAKTNWNKNLTDKTKPIERTYNCLVMKERLIVNIKII